MLRALLSIVIGGIIAFVLFVIMAELIANSSRAPDEVPPIPVIDIVMDAPDESTQNKVRVPPPVPPPPEQPPEIQKQEPDNSDSDAINMTFDAPTVNTGGTDISMGGIGAMQADGDAQPIFRVEPRYPAQAARDGKEGWVILSFTINEIGGVEDVVILDAKPKRVFDREARRALRKWKYRPKVVNGKPEKQFNQKVQLDFNLDKS